MQWNVVESFYGNVANIILTRYLLWNKKSEVILVFSYSLFALQ